MWQNDLIIPSVVVAAILEITEDQIHQLNVFLLKIHRYKFWKNSKTKIILFLGDQIINSI